MGELFVIPVIDGIYGQGFEVFTLVSDMHETMDLVFGIQEYI